MSLQQPRIQRRTGHPVVDEIIFGKHVTYIETYLHHILQQNSKGKQKKRTYLIELHHSNGFAFIKFYPRHCKKNRNKYSLRGQTELGYRLSVREIMGLLLRCFEIMHLYLNKYPDNFICYVGQPDSKDDSRNRDAAQRYSIYNKFTTSSFSEDKYKHSTKKAFGQINLKLIRKYTTPEALTMSSEQRDNYLRFSTILQEMDFDNLSAIMTKKAREEYLKKP